MGRSRGTWGRRVVSAVTSLAMVWSLTPAAAFAEAGQPPAEAGALEEPAVQGGSQPAGEPQDGDGGAHVDSQDAHDAGVDSENPYSAAPIEGQEESPGPVGAEPSADADPMVGEEPPESARQPSSAEGARDDSGEGAVQPPADGGPDRELVSSAADEVRDAWLLASREDADATASLRTLFDAVVANTAVTPPSPEGDKGDGGLTLAERAESDRLLLVLSDRDGEQEAPTFAALRELLASDASREGMLTSFEAVARELGYEVSRIRDEKGDAWALVRVGDAWGHVDPMAAVGSVSAILASPRPEGEGDLDAEGHARRIEGAAHSWLFASDGAILALDPSRAGWTMDDGGDVPEARGMAAGDVGPETGDAGDLGSQDPQPPQEGATGSESQDTSAESEQPSWDADGKDGSSAPQVEEKKGVEGNADEIAGSGDESTSSNGGVATEDAHDGPLTEGEKGDSEKNPETSTDGSESEPAVEDGRTSERATPDAPETGGKDAEKAAPSSDDTATGDSAGTGDGTSAQEPHGSRGTDEASATDATGTAEEEMALVLPPKSTVPVEDDEVRFIAIESDEPVPDGPGWADGGDASGGMGPISIQSTLPQEKLQRLKALIVQTVAHAREGSVDISGYGITCEQFTDLYRSVVSENSDFFYASSWCRYSYYSDGTVADFEPIYRFEEGESPSDVVAKRARLDEAVAEVISWVPAGASDLEKVEAVFSWLSKNVSYDYESYLGGVYDNHEYDMFGALVVRSCVCSGYADAFDYLMGLLGVPCVKASAHNHAWNIVKVGSYWYHVDATWGHPYFMKSDAGIQDMDKRYSSYYKEDGEVTHSDYSVYGDEGDTLGARTGTSYDRRLWENEWDTFDGPASSGQANAFTLSQSSMTLKTGAGANLQIASVSPSGANKCAPIWTSSNSSVAYVTSKGFVAAGTKVGKATLTCKLGTTSRTCVVTVRGDIAEASVSGLASKTYTGSAITCSPIVKVRGITLKLGTDYTLSYKNNTNVGTATVIITGKGSYKGTKSVSFEIKPGYPDVPASHWACGVVGRATDLDLISGYKDGNFGPSDRITRGQIAIILWRMAGRPAAKSGARSFRDVGTGASCYKAVRWASSVGVVNGYGDGRFGPNDNVTREQLAAMLANYARKVAGRAVSGSAKDYASMKDAAKVGKSFRSVLGWCYRNKLMSGTADGRIDPKGNATRAQAAKMIVGLHDLVA